MLLQVAAIYGGFFRIIILAREKGSSGDGSINTQKKKNIYG